MSKLLSVDYKTLRSRIIRYETTGYCKFPQPEKVGRKRLFNDNAAILTYLELHPDADGKELRNVLAPHIAQSCFYNMLSRLGVTYKKRGKV